jgi:hypothetical protein
MNDIAARRSMNRFYREIELELLRSGVRQSASRLHRDCQVCPDEPGYGELHLTPKASETINDCRRLSP